MIDRLLWHFTWNIFIEIYVFYAHPDSRGRASTCQDIYMDLQVARGYQYHISFKNALKSSLLSFQGFVIVACFSKWYTGTVLCWRMWSEQERGKKCISEGTTHWHIISFIIYWVEEKFKMILAETYWTAGLVPAAWCKTQHWSIFLLQKQEVV